MTDGLLVMAYGTPSAPEAIEEYYTHIRRGRPPEQAQLAELTARYESIGGTSPLAQRTRAQRDAIAAALEKTQPGRWKVRLGQKHAEPFIEDGVEELGDVDRIVGLVLAPHFSSASVGQYHERGAGAAALRGTPYVGIRCWHMEPELVEFQAEAVRDRLAGLPERTHVVFTAHSLPERVLVDDPYAEQLHESAQQIAQRAGLARWAGWGLGWQSAGRTPEPWRGPDLLRIIDDLAATARSDALLVVPQGFTSDHLEVLYDLDIEAASAARGAGLEFARTPVPNADPGVMAALAARVVQAADGLPT